MTVHPTAAELQGIVIKIKKVSISNKRAKVIATEYKEITEDFFSVSSVLFVADKYKQ